MSSTPDLWTHYSKYCADTRQMCKQESKQNLNSVNLKNKPIKTWEEQKVQYLLQGNKSN